MRAQRAAADGDTAEALRQWRASLAQDPLPIRAPLEADDVIRASSGAQVVDLAEQVGPLPRAELFTDVLHPSELGALRIAQALEPTLRAQLLE